MVKTINISDELWIFLNSQRTAEVHKFEDVIWKLLKQNQDQLKKEVDKK